VFGAHDGLTAVHVAAAALDHTLINALSTSPHWPAACDLRTLTHGRTALEVAMLCRSSARDAATAAPTDPTATTPPTDAPAATTASAATAHLRRDPFLAARSTVEAERVSLVVVQDTAEPTPAAVHADSFYATVYSLLRRRVDANAPFSEAGEWPRQSPLHAALRAGDNELVRNA
jgi:hypothetical protein